jgi:hypothetical protein
VSKAAQWVSTVYIALTTKSSRINIIIKESRRRLHIGEENLPSLTSISKIKTSSKFSYSRKATGLEAHGLCPDILILQRKISSIHKSLGQSRIVFTSVHIHTLLTECSPTFLSTSRSPSIYCILSTADGRRTLNSSTALIVSLKKYSGRLLSLKEGGKTRD